MRYKELDGLRGCASLTVLFSHFIAVFPIIDSDTYGHNITILNVMKYSPLHIVYAGHEAVILFFILSGFVLTIPYLSGDISYKIFITKRISRIYIPYISAVMISLIMFELFSKHGISQLSNWFNLSWIQPVTLSDIVSHVAFIGYFNTLKLDNPIWSLVHEMRISLIFPFLVYFSLRHKWVVNITMAAVMALLAFICSHFIRQTLPMLNDFLSTIQYVFMFIIGITLAQHRDLLILKYRDLNVYIRIFLVISAVFFYTYSFQFYGIKILHVSFINDCVTALGSSILVVIVLGYNRVMLLKPIQFLGKISYSLYLLHVPVLLSIVYIFYGRLPMLNILVIAFIVAIIFATLSYRFIEIPSIELGKRLTRFKNHNNPKKVV